MQQSSRTRPVSAAQIDVFKSELVRGAHFSPVYEFPLLKAVNFKPSQALPFEKASGATNCKQWVHFYTHDYQFERVWNSPARYLPILRRFEGVITPDFSLYREMPLAMQIWNTYRNRALAFWLQREGVSIVPNIRWGDERTYEFAFEGLPTGGTVAVSAHGTLRNKVNRGYFKAGLARMVERLQPQTIITYSQTPNDIFGEYKEQDLEVIEIPYHVVALRKEAA